MTDQIKLEDTLIDYMEIIISMNAKLNNHIHGTKLSIRELDAKVGGSGGNFSSVARGGTVGGPMDEARV